MRATGLGCPSTGLDWWQAPRATRVSRIANGIGPQAHRVDACASSKSREPTSAMAVNEPGFGLSADGKGEEGIDRSFEWTGIPKYLGE